MDNFSSWGELILQSLQDIWIKIVSFSPRLLAAFFILILGLFVSVAMGRFAKKLFTYTRIDKMNEKFGVKKEMESLGMRFTFSDLIGGVVKWFFIIVTFITVVDILHIPQLSRFLDDVALYWPNIIVAIVILAIGLIAGRLVHDISEKSLKASLVPDTSVKVMTGIIKWSIFIFALMAALVQLGVASTLIQILFTGVVIMLALAGGLAFGMAGRGKAAKIIDKIEQEFSQKKEEKTTEE